MKLHFLTRVKAATGGKAGRSKKRQIWMVLLLFVMADHPWSFWTIRPAIPLKTTQNTPIEWFRGLYFLKRVYSNLINNLSTQSCFIVYLLERKIWKNNSQSQRFLAEFKNRGLFSAATQQGRKGRDFQIPLKNMALRVVLISLSL